MSLCPQGERLSGNGPVVVFHLLEMLGRWRISFGVKDRKVEIGAEIDGECAISVFSTAGILELC